MTHDYTKTKIAAAVLLFCLTVGIAPYLLGARDRLPISATATGVSGDALSGGTTTDAIQMQSHTLLTQASLFVDVTAGTSTSMTITCQASDDASTWYDVMACESGGAGVYNCETWTPTYDLTSNTEIVVNLPSNYPWIRCTLTDPGGGTGTVTVKGFKGEV